jgi:hypothetical protein
MNLIWQKTHVMLVWGAFYHANPPFKTIYSRKIMKRILQYALYVLLISTHSLTAQNKAGQAIKFIDEIPQEASSDYIASFLASMTLSNEEIEQLRAHAQVRQLLNVIQALDALAGLESPLQSSGSYGLPSEDFSTLETSQDS